VYRDRFQEEDVVFYSYWLGAGAFIGSKLKKQFPHMRVVSRAHGADVFESRSYNHGYLPYRTMLPYRGIDKIYPASFSALSHLFFRNNYISGILEVIKLGVDSHSCVSNYHKNGKAISLLSCSAVDDIKRVDLIYTSLAAFVEKHSSIKLKWVHIGDGPNKKSLERSVLSGEIQGFEVQFLGMVDNNAVLSYYCKNPVDVFITTSSSEGGNPISIMEALSFGVPVIGTDVGGIPEAIDSEVGFLLSCDFTRSQFVTALEGVLERNNQVLRRACRARFEENFDAQKNYNLFLRKVMELDTK